MNGIPILSVIVLAPVVGALMIALFGGDSRIPRALALGAATVSLGGSIWAYVRYDRVLAGFQFAESVRWIPSLGVSYSLGADGISIPMLLLTGIVIFTSVLMSWNVENRPREYFALMLLAVTGIMGVFAARDAFLLLFFYEMAALPMYLLIAVWGSTRKEYSAMKLTLYLFAGGALLVLMLVLTYWQVGAGTFDMAVWSAHKFTPAFEKLAFLLAFLGFAVKIPAWPLHTWLPDGHSAAPTAVSAILAGVLLKIGAYGLIRLGLMTFPVGWSAWANVIAVIAVINIVYGALCAMNQTDLKYVVGYSSVSHMGYVLLGLAMGNRSGLTGATFQMFAHGIMTALFFGLIGYVYESAHTRQIGEISGLMQRTPLIAMCFVIAAASNMGTPSTAGFVAELLVYIGVVTRSVWLAGAAFVSIIITAGYMLRLLSRILFGEPSEAVASISDPRPIRFAPLAILAGAIMLVGIFPASLFDTITLGVMPIVNKLAGG